MADLQDLRAKELFAELSEFEKRGVDMSLNGYPASPMQIVQAHILREDVTYMRDYEMNEKGDIRGLGFQIVKL